MADTNESTTKGNMTENIPHESSHHKQVVITEETMTCDEIFAFESLLPIGQREVEQYDDPMAYKAVADPDTMYWHQAMKEPDRAKF